MVPSTSDNGSRLAAILPTAVALMREHPQEVRHTVAVVVDGLGWANLQARLGHAPQLRRWQNQRIETVVPSTTGAALTALTTGTLPGEHGLIGYRIRDPRTCTLAVTLNEWDHVTDTRTWQRSATVFERAAALGFETTVVARPAHANSPFTQAVLTGANYVPGQTIAERFTQATTTLHSAHRAGRQSLTYIYVDELDRAGHKHGWESSEWLERLEQLDESLADCVNAIPAGTGIVLTADHGMVDIPEAKHVLLDELCQRAAVPVQAFGGEPRLRYLYLDAVAPTEAAAGAGRLQRLLGENAWVGSRDEWIDAGVFGRVGPQVRPRIGDIIVAARARVAFYSHDDDPASLTMIGQHGSFDDDERGIPFAVAGVFGSAAAAGSTPSAGASFRDRVLSAANEV